MIFAHLPAGYVTARLLQKRMHVSDVAWKTFLVAGLLGSVAPDFDLLYYFIIDQQRHHHHTYFTHFPVFWISLLAVSCLWYRFASNKRWATLAVIFSLNGFIHLILDSVAGNIRWLAPWDFQRYALTKVPHMTGSRRLDYLMHWSFLFELIPIVWAGILWKREKSSPSPAGGTTYT
jgi:hypothetical protein